MALAATERSAIDSGTATSRPARAAATSPPAPAVPDSRTWRATCAGPRRRIVTSPEAARRRGRRRRNVPMSPIRRPDRRTARRARRGPGGTEALSEARVQPRTAVRDHGARVRQDQHHHHRVPAHQKELLTAAAPALMADVLTRHGRLRVRAFGSSMLPAIRPGDVLCIEQCTPEAARPGRSSSPGTANAFSPHRLVRKDRHGGEDLLVTRDDALLACRCFAAGVDAPGTRDRNQPGRRDARQLVLDYLASAPSRHDTHRGDATLVARPGVGRVGRSRRSEDDDRFAEPFHIETSRARFPLNFLTREPVFVREQSGVP